MTSINGAECLLIPFNDENPVLYDIKIGDVIPGINKSSDESIPKEYDVIISKIDNRGIWGTIRYKVLHILRYTK